MRAFKTSNLQRFTAVPSSGTLLSEWMIVVQEEAERLLI